MNTQTTLQRQLETVRQVEAEEVVRQIEAWMNQDALKDCAKGEANGN